MSGPRFGVQGRASFPILTDGTGRPIERPEAPGPGATLKQRIAWLRAFHDYNDRVADVANAAFARGLRS